MSQSWPHSITHSTTLSIARMHLSTIGLKASKSEVLFWIPKTSTTPLWVLQLIIDWILTRFHDFLSSRFLVRFWCLEFCALDWREMYRNANTTRLKCAICTMLVDNASPINDLCFWLIHWRKKYIVAFRVSTGCRLDTFEAFIYSWPF